MLPRRIALVYDVAYPFVDGGGERRMYEVGRRLAESGWDVHWYSLKVWGGDPIQRRDGITYHGLAGYTTLSREDGTRSRREALSFGRAILFCDASFSSYDVVWCGQWPYFHVLALIVRLVPWRTKLLYDWWEVWGREWLLLGFLTGIIGWLLETGLARLLTRIGHVVAISTLGAKQLLALGAKKASVFYIPNGVNVELYARAHSAPGSSDIASFGRLKNHKNIDHLVSAVALLKRRGIILYADIVGDGPERERLEALARTENVAELLTFHGRIDDETLRSILKRNRVFVHPSTKEGGGSITLLEANASGLPVVCYRHPKGIDSALIVENETGIIVDPVSPEALANGIVQMLRSAGANPVREKCEQYARKFDWDEIAREYKRLLDVLVQPCSEHSNRNCARHAGEGR